MYKHQSVEYNDFVEAAGACLEAVNNMIACANRLKILAEQVEDASEQELVVVKMEELDRTIIKVLAENE